MFDVVDGTIVQYLARPKPILLDTLNPIQHEQDA
jgi:hypothetical protein